MLTSQNNLRNSTFPCFYVYVLVSLWLYADEICDIDVFFLKKRTYFS